MRRLDGQTHGMQAQLPRMRGRSSQQRQNAASRRCGSRGGSNLEGFDDAIRRAIRIRSTAGDCSSRAASLPVWSQTVGLAASIPARVRRDGRCRRLEPNPTRRGRREAQRTRRTCPAIFAAGSFACDEVVAILAAVTAVDARLRFAPLSPSTVACTTSAFAFISAYASPAGERAAPRRSVVRCGFLPIWSGLFFLRGLGSPPPRFFKWYRPRGTAITPPGVSLDPESHDFRFGSRALAA